MFPWEDSENQDRVFSSKKIRPLLIALAALREIGERHICTSVEVVSRERCTSAGGCAIVGVRRGARPGNQQSGRLSLKSAEVMKIEAALKQQSGCNLFRARLLEVAANSAYRQFILG
jgi:hypothetical protein